jgi:zinc transporter, ZIP family
LSNFVLMMVLATVMGLSIFLSLPIVLRRTRTARLVNFLGAAAVGILVFIIADVWGNVATLIYPNGSFLTNLPLDLVFVAGALGSFLGLFLIEHFPGRKAELTPISTAFIVALAIGFQNLTEGLVFGAAWAAGALGLLSVVFAGFFVQNVTEGFPIAGPLLRSNDRRVGLFSGFFILGGIPSTIGAGIGYFWTSTPLIVAFDALAIGTCLYAILPMMKAAFRPADTPEATQLKLRLTYLGIGLGFVLGFVVNAF